jgi:hypothetical protein
LFTNRNPFQNVQHASENQTHMANVAINCQELQKKTHGLFLSLLIKSQHFSFFLYNINIYIYIYICSIFLWNSGQHSASQFSNNFQQVFYFYFFIKKKVKNNHFLWRSIFQGLLKWPCGPYGIFSNLLLVGIFGNMHNISTICDIPFCKWGYVLVFRLHLYFLFIFIQKYI